jgi:hypothetical protein
MGRLSSATAGVAALSLAIAIATASGTRVPDDATCAEPSVDGRYAARVRAASDAKTDMWGDALLRSPAGPTYDGARRYLAPLLLARADHGANLTDSGVHYLPFGRPAGPQGSGSVPLHVADGSQVVSQRRSGRTLTVGVGRAGRERYGSCRARLAGPQLAGGWLPVLKTSYVDAGGGRYRQESFAAPLPGGALASFVRVSADASGSALQGRRIRFGVSGAPPLTVAGTGLERSGSTYLAVSAGATLDRTSATFDVPVGGTRTVYAVWTNAPAPAAGLTLDARSYAAARASAIGYWRNRLGAGAEVVVPEQRVTDAMHSLLWQNLVLGWRYSVGNHYQQLATADGLAAADVIGRYGFADVNRETLRVALSPRRPQAPYRNWKLGAKLAGVGQYDSLFHDTAFVEEVTPVLRGYVAELGAQIDGDPRGILRRERYSSDVRDSVYGLHAQAVVWNGLRLMGRAWARTGHPALARRCRALAARLGAGLRSAVRRSSSRLADGSLFVPMRLYDDERPYDAVTESRAGSYWNLVAPYAFATGILRPGSDDALAVLAYLDRHGARLLGLVRTGAYALFGDGGSPSSGTNQVYGLSAARFLAGNDRADQLVLTLYGQLAAGMAPGTFVSGEAASVTPLPGTRLRAMYLPPNGTSNAAFLETLRLLLVHETSDAAGRPLGLELAYATPRAWLAPGRRIAVRGMPTSFGPVSFSLVRTAGAVRVSIDLPAALTARGTSVRLRLPSRHIVAVQSGGRPLRLEPDGETIRLSGTGRHVALVATVGP